MNEPLPYDNPIFYSRSTLDPIFKITLDDLLTPSPPDFKISINFQKKSKPKIDIKNIIMNKPFTFLMQYQYPDFHRSSHIFNYNNIILLENLIPEQNFDSINNDGSYKDDIIIKDDYQTLFYFPIFPYDPNYIGIHGNLTKLINKSATPVRKYDPFKYYELLQIIQYMFPELWEFLVKNYNLS